MLVAAPFRPDRLGTAPQIDDVSLFGPGNWAIANVSARYVNNAPFAVEAVKDPYLRAHSLLDIAQHCERTNDTRCADEFLLRAQRLVASINSHSLRAVTWGHIAFVKASSKGDPFLQAIDEAIKVPDDDSEALSETARLLLLAGEGKRARQLWSKAVQRALANDGPMQRFELSSIAETIAQSGVQDMDDIIFDG